MSEKLTKDEEAQKFIDYRFNEVDKKLSRIEAKMDGYTYAKQSEVDSLATTAVAVNNRITILEQKIKPIEKIYYLVLGAFATGIVGLGFWFLQKAVGK